VRREFARLGGEAQAAHPPFDFRLKVAQGRVGPHTVVARVRPNAALSDLQAEIERRVRRLGLAPEPRKFTPHVTLARLRHATPHDVADYLSIRPALALPAFVADRVALFSARESVGGGPYHLETTFALA